MKEIVIVSGKGGTGKTSLAAALALLEGDRAIVADCDVDAANMHILLNPDYDRSSDFYGGHLAWIDPVLCTRCGVCAGICRFGAIRTEGGIHRVNPLDCEGCGYCEMVCPEKAIRMDRRKSGQLFISRIRTGGWMVHARMDVGAENSGKLVARVKREAAALAREAGLDWVIVDGSPGIGCPVISSLSGAGYAILVTEPTVTGIHDLKRILALVRRFRIPAGCIINKQDLNPEISASLKEFLASEQVDHLADIDINPLFYQAMLQGKTIVEYPSPLRSILVSAWEKVKSRNRNKLSS